MRVLFDGRRVRPVRRFRTVTREAEHCAGLMRSALLPVPWTSWQLKHVTPRVYITLCAKSFPCIRFLWAVPSAKCVNVCSPSLCSSSSQKSCSLRPGR